MAHDAIQRIGAAENPFQAVAAQKKRTQQSDGEYANAGYLQDNLLARASSGDHGINTERSNACGSCLKMDA